MLFLLLVFPAMANPNLEAGREFLADKLVDPAISSLQLCIDEEPSNADCHWEMGWAKWLKNDWSGVVQHWEKVSAIDPERTGLEKYLGQARDQKRLRERIRAGRDAAAETYRSAVPDSTTVRIRAVSDLMIGTDFPEGVLPDNDGRQSFAAVREVLRDADVTFGNLEGPLCDGGSTSKCKPGAPAGSCYAFRMPARYAPYFKDAGFDMLSTANNHAGDFGEVCRKQTESLLDEQGIAHSGRPGDIATVQANGLKIAMVGFHTNAATHNVNDTETAIALVRSLTTSHDIVIVSFHGGAEGSKAMHVPEGREFFYGEDRGDLRMFTHAVVDAGADLVLGHGPHVLRAIEVYKDRLIAYSLGNFATYGRFTLKGPNGLGVVLDVTLAADGRFVGGSLVPTRQEGAGTVVLDPSLAGIDMIRMLSDADFPDSGVRVAQDGTIAAR